MTFNYLHRQRRRDMQHIAIFCLLALVVLLFVLAS